MTVFKNYAQYYDLLYQDKNYMEEVDYIEKLINTHSKIPVKTILDLGCGTGRHDSLFAERNYEITGVDLSEKMIEIAKSQNSKNSEFIVGDVREITLNKQFDAVISLFHVASYQTTNQDFENYLKTAYRHLKNGGVFIFDFWYGPGVLTDPPVVRIKRLENEEIKILRIAEPIMYYKKNTVDVNFDIIVENKKTNSFEKINETHEMRYWFLPEIECFLAKTGFTNLHSNEWMTDKGLGNMVWYGVMVIQKSGCNG